MSDTPVCSFCETEFEEGSPDVQLFEARGYGTGPWADDPYWLCVLCQDTQSAQRFGLGLRDPEWLFAQMRDTIRVLWVLERRRQRA